MYAYVFVCVSRSVMSDSLQPHGLWLLCRWDSPSKNTRVGCRSLLYGISLTQGLNLSLLHCKQMLCHLSHQGSPCEHEIWLIARAPKMLRFLLISILNAVLSMLLSFIK